MLGLASGFIEFAIAAAGWGEIVGIAALWSRGAHALNGSIGRADLVAAVVVEAGGFAPLLSPTICRTGAGGSDWCARIAGQKKQKSKNNDAHATRVTKKRREEREGF